MSDKEKTGLSMWIPEVGKPSYFGPRYWHSFFEYGEHGMPDTGTVLIVESVDRDKRTVTFRAETRLDRVEVPLTTWQRFLKWFKR